MATETDQTLIVIDDAGKAWELQPAQYQVNPVTDPTALAVINEIIGLGVYVAFPQTISVGIGGYCTVVNIGAILRNQPSATYAKGSPALPRAIASKGAPIAPQGPKK